MPARPSHLKMKIGPARVPAWALLTLLIIAGAGAATGLILKDQVDGKTTVAVSQAIRIDHTQFGANDVSGDADEVLVTVNDDGMEWAVHLEANNGDIIYIDLPVVNEAEKRITAELKLWGNSPYTIDVEPIFYWSDRNHDGKYTQEEAVLDQRPTTDKLELERADIVVATGWVDYDNFTTNHWFFDGSYAGGGTYGYGNIYGSTYDDNIFSDYDGEDPEAILLDGNTIGKLDPGLLDGTGDTVVTAGRAALYEDLGAYTIGRILFNDANSDTNWDTNEDIFYSRDGDAFWSTMADVLIDADGSPTNGGTADAGIAAAIAVGDSLKAFDTDDEVYYYDAVGGDIFDGAADVLWKDLGDDAYYNENGQSVGGATPVTDLSTTLNPSINLDLNGGGVSTPILENSRAITAATLSEIGLDNNLFGIVPGDVVEIDAKGYYYILSSTTGFGAMASATLIGDVATIGDEVKGYKLDKQSNTIFAQVGSVTVAGGQSIGADGKKSLSVDNGLGAVVDASGLTAGSVYLIDDDGTPDAGSAYVIMDATGAGSTTSVSILGQASKSIRDDDVFYDTTQSDSGTQGDIDDYYLDSGSDIAASLEDIISGTVTYDSPGFSGRYKVDSTWTTAASSVIITDGTSGNNVADVLKLGTGNGGTENGRDLLLRDTGGVVSDDSTTGSEVSTSTTVPFAYVSADGTYDEGEDIYEEESGNALTYTSAADLPETVVYEGAGPNVAAGGAQFDASAARFFTDSDNIMYRDTNHDDNYDFGEPLLYTGGSDINVEGQLTSAVTVLARADDAATGWVINNANEMFKLEDDFNGANGHHYYFVDDNNDGLYTDGEAIIDQILGSDLIRLEKSDLAPSTDFVIHHGLANLLPFPLVQVDGAETWKFEVPDVNIIGDPLEIRITIAIEDAAPTGFYTIQGRIRPLNV